MIKIQKKDFNIEKEIRLIKNIHHNVGAVSTFIGYVRNINNKKNVKSIDLEVYPEMTVKYLEELCQKVFKKWNIIDILIIHRHGKIEINNKIVLVATFSIHRKDSTKACEYIMDYLKKNAPIWKKEEYNNKTEWI